MSSALSKPPSSAEGNPEKNKETQEHLRDDPNKNRSRYPNDLHQSSPSKIRWKYKGGCPLRAGPCPDHNVGNETAMVSGHAGA